MELINQYKDRFVIAILIVLLMFSFTRCIDSKEDSKRLKNALELAELKNQKFEIEVNEKGERISSQKQVILTQEEALRGNLLEIEDLKKYKNIKTKIEYVTTTIIDTLKVPYLSDTSSVVLPNFSKFFEYKEKSDWFSLKGNATNEGVFFSKIEVKNKYELIIADRKMGLFKKAEPQISLKNLNPYTVTESMNNVQIFYNKPFYKKEWFWFVIGGATTLLITK